MEDKTLVSIGVMVYNHEAYIGDCLNSILQQDYSNIELIILDDASTDKSREIIDTYYEKLQQKFQKVVLIYHEKNGGKVTANENEIIRHACGYFYKGISGDDLMMPQYISSLVNCMQNDPDIAVVYSNGYVVDDDFKLGERFGRKKILSQKPVNDIGENVFKRLMLRNWIPAPTAMFRKNIFDKYGLYDESIPYEDYEYWLRVSRKEKLYYLDRELILYRKSVDSMSNFRGKNAKKKLKTAMHSDQMTIQKYLRYLSEEDRKKTITAFYSYYYKLAYDTNFYRGFLAAAYRSKKYNPEICLGFGQMLLNMLFPKLAAKNSGKWKAMSDKHLAIMLLFNQWLTAKQSGKDIKEYFFRKGYQKIVIYGMSYAGERLLDELAHSDIEVVAAIDKNAKDMIEKVPVIAPDEEIPACDCIVVTAISFFDEIERFLMQKVSCPVVSLEDILYEM